MPSAYEKSQIVQTYVTLLPPGGRGVLPIMAYTGRLRPKGVPCDCKLKRAMKQHECSSLKTRLRKARSLGIKCVSLLDKL